MFSLPFHFFNPPSPPPPAAFTILPTLLKKTKEWYLVKEVKGKPSKVPWHKD
jgi:hypothetical protein